MRVKICGITNLEDALLAIDAGADALGFVFYEKSPRYISLNECAKIIEKLPPFIEKVGLFVNNTPQEINNMFIESKITLAQIHFDVNEDFLSQLNIPFIPVIRANKKEDIDKFSNYYRIIDAMSEQYGGSGKRLNLEWFKERDNHKIIIAGGLTPNNIHEIKNFDFYGVDVSSGTEEFKGKKSPQKVIDFIKIAKR